MIVKHGFPMLINVIIKILLGMFTPLQMLQKAFSEHALLK